MDNRNITVVSGGGDIKESLFHNIVSVSNLLGAWKEFRKTKRKKKDVLKFEFHLEDNIWGLHQDLVSKSYKHNFYTGFYISDPKRRHIHKATVRDRVVHQAVYRVLYPIFDKNFIFDSYSSRKSKGTHLGVERSFKSYRKLSKNWKLKVFVLKCDIRKFFDSIDHNILRSLISKKISCADALELINLLLKSFEKETKKGLPLGNVTSQLFANIYMNEFDQFVKHKLKARYYFRYCDDFIILSLNQNYLKGLIDEISSFLYENLALVLHPNKIQIRTVGQGVDFLGYVSLPHMIVLRTNTKRRIYRKVKVMLKKLGLKSVSEGVFRATLTSYLGLLSHCRGRELEHYVSRFLKY